MAAQDRSAGDFVIESEIDTAIDALQGLAVVNPECRVHVPCAILMLRIDKQLLRGQHNAAGSVATLRAVVEEHEGRIVKVESRAFEAEPANMMAMAMRQAKNASPWMWVALTIVPMLATLWKWKGWV
jgi:hypothetical protein